MYICTLLSLSTNKYKNFLMIDSQKTGYVYILTNPSFRPDRIKIGKSKLPVDVRSKQLFNTSIPTPFEIYATIRTVRYNEVETMLHRFIDLLTDSRVNNSREFFDILPHRALEIFKIISTVIDDAFIEIYDNGKVTQTINHANYYSTESNLTQQTAPKPEQHTTKLATPEDKTAVHLYSMKSLPQYFGCLKGPYIKDVLLKANMPTDISTIISIPQLERLIELIQLKERERGDHNSYSRAVKMYIEYLQNGLGFKDFEYDSECMRRHNHLCKNK